MPPVVVRLREAHTSADAGRSVHAGVRHMAIGADPLAFTAGISCAKGVGVTLCSGVEQFKYVGSGAY